MTQPVKVDPWRRGDKLEARHLDQPRRAIDQIRDSIQTPPAARVYQGSLEIRCKIVSNSGDYLECRRIDSSGAEAASTIKVAKPYLLRNSLDQRGATTYVYTGTDARTATNGTSEDQVIVPSYLTGDEITAKPAPSGGTGVPDAPLWADANDDARAWAKKAS